MVISEEGTFGDLRVRVSVCDDAAANILSFALLEEAGHEVRRVEGGDFIVVGDTCDYRFSRKANRSGGRSPYWICNLALDSDVIQKAEVMVATVEDGLRRLTKREARNVEEAGKFIARMGHMAASTAARELNKGVQNIPITSHDVRNYVAVHGASIASLRGKTTKRSSAIATTVLAPMVTQVQQALDVDLFFIDRLVFLRGVMSPLGLSQCCSVNDRSVAEVRAGLEIFLAKATKRNFEIRLIRADNEGAMTALVPELNTMKVPVELAGPGQHVPVVERMIRTIKERYRCHVNDLPFVMTSDLRRYCIYFCVRSLNLQANSQSTDGTSPWEQYSGMKLDYKRDLRVAFGDYVEATVPVTDNTSAPRTEGCIALLPMGNLTGSVRMLRVSGGKPIVRDQFRVLPMPAQVALSITRAANRQGYSRAQDGSHVTQPQPNVSFPGGDTNIGVGPEMMAIAPPMDNQMHQSPTGIAPAGPDAGVIASTEDEIVQAVTQGTRAQHLLESESGVQDAIVAGEQPPSDTAEHATGGEKQADEPAPPAEPPPVPPKPQLPAEAFGSRWSNRLVTKHSARVVMFSTVDKDRAEIRRQLESRSDWHDCDFAFKISVRAALRERGDEAGPVIMAELQQMVDKGVWHPIDVRTMNRKQRQAIIRSSMFLKDKYLANGTFEKFKARLVAGGDQQDKSLYDNLSSPTAATASVLAVAAIAAAEGRYAATFDITGAFLNAPMKQTGVMVHMRLDKIMTAMLLKIDPSYERFTEPGGTMVVQLDKALYGCVEAAALWFKHLTASLIADGFVANPYDSCVFNKTAADGVQITIVLHVDLESVYDEVKYTSGVVINYVGMTFDFSVQGQVSVTMDNCINDILSGSGVTKARPTPASEDLFTVREDAPLVSADESKYFHTHVAKILYLAKRVRPECLTAVAFLSTRVQCCNVDDHAKLQRLLGYLLGTRHRGIVLRVGEHMGVKAYIDAAYGVHEQSGKSHTGCAIVLGDAGAVYTKSTKQKIVTKSSTEAELVGLSDTASQAIHLRNFVIAQGYEVGPAVIYQDNLSCMALMKRGGPASERSRHINIRHFWLCERIEDKEVTIEHLGTEKMFANVLTKPVQGAQFVLERRGLTNWD